MPVLTINQSLTWKQRYRIVAALEEKNMPPQAGLDVPLPHIDAARPGEASRRVQVTVAVSPEALGGRCGAFFVPLRIEWRPRGSGLSRKVFVDAGTRQPVTCLYPHVIARSRTGAEVAFTLAEWRDRREKWGIHEPR